VRETLPPQPSGFGERRLLDVEIQEGRAREAATPYNCDAVLRTR